MVDLPKKHGRGGQSALRFARLRLEKRHNYVRKVGAAQSLVAASSASGGAARSRLDPSGACSCVGRPCWPRPGESRTGVPGSAARHSVRRNPRVQPGRGQTKHASTGPPLRACRSPFGPGRPRHVAGIGACRTPVAVRSAHFAGRPVRSPLTVRQVGEMAVQFFITNDRPNVAGLVLAGSADFKTELSQ
jgi:hypothetical protein